MTAEMSLLDYHSWKISMNLDTFYQKNGLGFEKDDFLTDEEAIE